jgi:long-chain acyl-CoA synthetase
MDERATLASIADGFAARGNSIAVRSVRQSSVDDWSYGRLSDAIRRIADSIASASTEPSETIGLLLPNSAEWGAAYFAIIRAGGCVAPLDFTLGDEEVVGLLAAADCRRCITTRDRAARLRQAVRGAEPQLISIEAAVEPDHRASRTPTARAVSGPTVTAASVASLLFTSGTTGTPKIVPLTHRNLMHNVDALLSEDLVGPDDQVLLPLPLHHVFPLTVGLLTTLAGGGTVVFPEGLSGPQIIEALQRAKPTIMIGVPRLYESLVAGIERRAAARGRHYNRLYRAMLGASIAYRRATGTRLGRLLFPELHRLVGSRLRVLACGGAHLDDCTWLGLEGLGWEVLTGYGLTETAPVVTFTPRGCARIGTEGVPLPGVEVRADATEGSGFGEILVRGPNVFYGYKDDQVRTRAAFTSEGWFRTGDLGALDRKGYLRVLGRIDELVVLPDGKKVFPERIEEVYSRSPLIREAAVLLYGGQLVAIVVPDLDAVRQRGTARLKSVLNEEIEFLGQGLARFERVLGTAVVPGPLPRTRLGKLRRSLLPEIYAAALHLETASRKRLPAEPPPFATGLETRLWHWLEERFAGRAITLETSLQLDLGIDSLEWVNLTLELNQRFGVRLTEESLTSVITVRDLISVVATAAHGPRPTLNAFARGGAESEGLRWLEPRGFGLRSIGWCLYVLNCMIMRMAFRVRADGLEHVPLHGPVIITPNHTSALDPFAIAAVFPWRVLRETHWAGWTERLLAGRVTRLFSRVAQAIPVDPDRGPAAGLALAEKAVAKGKMLVWFPEGRRSPSGELSPLQPGIGVLIARTRAPVLPVHVSGTYRALRRGRAWPRPSRIRVRFGRLCDYASLDSSGCGDTSEARIINALHQRMALLAEESHRRSPSAPDERRQFNATRASARRPCSEWRAS